MHKVEYIYCKRCGKKLKSVEARERGMGDTCFSKATRALKGHRLFDMGSSFDTLTTYFSNSKLESEDKDMASNSVMIHKLQRALNSKGMRVLYTTSQFYSEEQDRPVTIYHLKRAVWDEEKHKNVNIELFKSTSQIQIVLFLRDMWFEAIGREVPQDNTKWNDIKEGDV